MQGRLVEGTVALSAKFGETVAEKVGEMSGTDWLVTAGVAFSAVNVTKVVAPLVQSYRKRNVKPQPAAIIAEQKQIEIKTKEERIKAYLNLADLKKSSLEFDETDSKLLAEFGHSLQTEEGQKHFFAYDAKHLGRSISKLFPNGCDTSYLRNDEYRDELRQIILGWANDGKFNNDNSPLMESLCGKLELLTVITDDEELFYETMQLAASDEVVDHFIKHYIDGQGWAPWFKVVKSEEAKHVLIALACKQQNVNIHVYNEDKCNDSVIAPLAAYGQANDTLHVLYDEKNGKLDVLDELTTPSRLYRWIALSACWDLLEQDPCNARALELAGSKGLAALTQFARHALAHEKLPKATVNALVKSLGLFIERHKGECQDDKKAAQEIQAALKEKYSSKFFTKNNFIAAAGAAAVIGLGAAIFSKSN